MGRGKRLEGKAHYYIHARVCVCAKGKRRKRAGRIHTEVFRTFLYHLSPVIISVPVHRGLRHGDRLSATYHRTCHLSPLSLKTVIGRMSLLLLVILFHSCLKHFVCHRKTLCFTLLNILFHTAEHFVSSR